MCGIAGYINWNNRNIDCGYVVEQMLSLMQYRGPDDSGIYESKSLAIGMNRLRIIDKIAYAVPYISTSKQSVLAYNGEVYNHDSLRNRLPNLKFKTNSDGESILEDIEHFGLKHLREYNGMYSFAFYDKGKSKLYLVRDKAGEKPLYYYQNNEIFCFASEIKALLPLNEIDSKIVLTNAYQSYEFTVGRETLIDGVQQLLPGEYLELDLLKQEATVHKYFELRDELIEIPDNEIQVENHLADLIEDSIKLRTKNCAHQFAVFTGGGVDSALMACIANPDELYYCHYDLGKAFDELEYAQLVAKQIDVPLNIIEPRKVDFEQTRDKIAFHLDTPCTWTSFSLWMILESLPKHIKVIMTGEGADEAFGGYHRYHLLHHDEQINKLKAMQDYSYLIQKYYGSPVERYVKLINRCTNKYDQRVLEYLNRTVSEYFDKVDGDIIHGMGMHDFYTTMQVLLQMSDRMSMAFSVENRSPFLDYRLLQFAFSLPSKYKIRDGLTKWLLKQVARRFIPKAIVDRIDKRGFSAPLNIWFGWDKLGKYNRSMYRDIVFQDFKGVIETLDMKPYALRRPKEDLIVS